MTRHHKLHVTSLEHVLNNMIYTRWNHCCVFPFSGVDFDGKYGKYGSPPSIVKFYFYQSSLFTSKMQHT